MRKLLAILSLLVLGGVGMVSSAWADGMTQIVDATTSGAGRLTATVFNNSAGTIVSGAVVVWDHDVANYDNTGYPQVTTSTTLDDIYTAGVMLTGSCPDQQLCEIVTKGWAATYVSVATLTEDTVVGTSTTASSIGDASAGNNVCYLGTLISYTEVVTGNHCTSSAICLVPVQVNITCVP